MGYYRGDFYRGYRGDPGFLSFLGGIAKSAVGLIPGVGPGLASLIPSVGAKSAVKLAAPATMAAAGIASSGGMAIIKKGAAAVSGAIVKHPVLSAAGAAGALGAASGAVAAHMMAPAAHMRGFHISRKTGNMVRNRHMNPCNPRALRRSIRRAMAFKKLALKTIHLVAPKAAKGKHFGGFKKRRKAS